MIHFISDLHLHPSRPRSAETFLAFLAGPARQGEALWILGDLFEVWAGDDALAEPFNARIARALAELAATGVSISLIVGNRDFLLGARFAHESGVRLVQEPARLTLGAHIALVLHGDAQCTDDIAYQRFRRVVRQPMVQRIFLCLPQSLRQRIVSGARMQSEQAKQGKPQDIMDVNAGAIASLFQSSGADWIIHGHTHRPASHPLQIAGRSCTRHVLPDWHDEACGLVWDGQQLRPFPPAPAH